jgi:hypothetical protein
MEAARTSETSVDNYSTRQYIPEDNSELLTLRRENLKSHSRPDDGAARTSETSVDNYSTRQYIPEDNSELHTRRRENLKSHRFTHVIHIFYYRFAGQAQTVALVVSTFAMNAFGTPVTTEVSSLKELRSVAYHTTEASIIIATKPVHSLQLRSPPTSK